MSETKNVITLLRAFELDVAAQAKALLSSKLGADLKDSVAAFLGTDTSDEEQSCEFRLLVSLKIRAQQEIVDEQELLIFEQAASLAATMAKLARHASEIEHAKLLSTQRQEFVAMLTHDLKNPLIGANRILDLFTGGQLGALTSTQRELLEQLISSNKESLQLITMLGDIYRYDSDPGDVHLEQSDLLSVVEFSFKAMETWSLQREIRATLTVPKSLPLMYIDRLAVQRLLDNLFGNALKFTAPKGCIDVTLTAIPGKVLIEVRDDGPGIPDDEKKRLFHRFSQGVAGRRYSAGSGLGLYLCKQIVEAHNGRIECLNCDVGSLFRVTLSTQLAPCQSVPELSQAI